MEIVAAIIRVVRIRNLCGGEGRTCNENQAIPDAAPRPTFHWPLPVGKAARLATALP